jgi:hypothetical protein
VAQGEKAKSGSGKWEIGNRGKVEDERQQSEVRRQETEARSREQKADASPAGGIYMGDAYVAGFAMWATLLFQ